MRGRGRRSTRKKRPNIRVPIYKVLKQVHPDKGISRLAMCIMADFVWDVYKRILKEAVNVAEMFHKRTVNSREIQTASRLELGGHLAKHAVSEGTKAVTKLFMSVMDKSAKGVRKRQSVSARSGLQFPCGAIRSCMKMDCQQRIGMGAPSYLAAVLEYLTAEILNLAGNAASADKKRRITPRHIQYAFHDDEELSMFAKHVFIPQGGVVPFIGARLLQKSTKTVLPRPS